MIRPYFTVIRDAFDEALASRVLWFLLAASTLVLLALAPLGIVEQRPTELRLDSVTNWPGLINKLRNEGSAATPSPSRRIIELADKSTQDKLGIETTGPNEPTLTRDMVEGVRNHLNALLKRPDFYRPDDWVSVHLDDDLKELLQNEIQSSPAADVAYINWRLLKASYPDETTRAPAEDLHLSYFHWPVGPPLPVNRSMLNTAIQQIVAAVMNFLVGTVAVFIAILVTSPLVPQTFEAGAIDLLLSKPVSRSLLFLSKFFGACTFILLNAGYFILGLWLIVGLRFGFWNNSLLFCVPIFMFLFLIYYSVSALAGVLWRNATVSIVVAILFWAACFVVGLGNDLIEQIYLVPNRIVNLFFFDETLMAVSHSGQLSEWRNGRWELAFAAPESRGGPPIPFRQILLGPVHPDNSDQVLYVPQPRQRGRFGFLESGPPILVATWADGTWRQTTGPTSPAGTSWLLHSPNSGPILVAKSGIRRIINVTPSASTTRLFGLSIPGANSMPFEALGPEPELPLSEPFSAAIHPTSGDLVLWNAGTLHCLARQTDGPYRETRQIKMDEAVQPAALASGGNRVIVAESNGRVSILDATNLQIVRQFRPAGKSEPYLAGTSQDGNWFAVLFHSGKLILYDNQSDKNYTLHRNASAFAFAPQGQILVADQDTRVLTYDLATRRVMDRRQPPYDVMQRAYRWFIHPFYLVFPKPGELGEVVNYFLTDRETVALGPQESTDLRQSRETLNVSGALLSSLGFVAVVLTITCLYIQRLDL